MKINAIIRIVIWSLVVVILLGILSIGLGITRILPSKTIAASPAESAAPQRLEEAEPTTYLGTSFYVEETTNIRAKPTRMGEVRGAVEAGQTIFLTRDEIINGEHWGHIQEPVQGWICLDSNAGETAAAQPAATDPTMGVDYGDVVPPSANDNVVANGYGCNASDVSDISIEWAAGNIMIIPAEGSRIRVEETGDFEKHPMTIRNKNGKLSIEYSEGMSLLGLKSTKDLTIEVPKDFYLKELEIQAASANVSILELNVGKVELETAKGICDFRDCTVDTLDVDTASGDIIFAGSLNQLECDAASANFVASISNVPSRIEMESMSGNLDLTLPKDAGFTLTMEGLRSNFTSDFTTTCDTNRHQEHGHSTCDRKTHISGNGACKIQVEAASGEVILRKAK